MSSAGGHRSHATIAAIATPPGRGGVAIIRISGSEALSIFQRLSLQPENKPKARMAQLSAWYDDDGELLDQGVVIRFPSPNSYTGEDVIELQGHGGPVLVKALLQRLYQLGCRPAEPGEFTRRAVENGKLDLSQAEAVAACIDAATLRAGKQAQKQLQGRFGECISAFMDRLTALVAHLEASLDFPEDEIPALFFDHIRDQLHAELIDPITALLATSSLGERLFDGATVAIVGSPNVGKSSLLNALAGRDRAIVSDRPGTTRDVLEIDFEVHGIPVRLADTAGMRDSGDPVEQEGVRRAHRTAIEADAVLFVADAGRPDTWESPVQADIWLMNKMDAVSFSAPEPFLALSVASGDGLDLLRARLADLLGDMPLGDEGLMVTRERHRELLESVLQHLQAGCQLLGREDQLELCALEWRYAWGELGSILGIGDVEYILDRVFSEFCVGK